MSLRPLVVAAMAAALFTGCDDDATGPDGDTVAGTYTLVRVNGFPPPVPVATFDADGMSCVQSATGGTLTLRSDQTWDSSTQVVDECTDDETGEETTSNATLDASGTYAQSGNSLSFQDPVNAPFMGALSGDTLTLTAADEDVTLTLEFMRQ